jgi:hypothetical protein
MVEINRLEIVATDNNATYNDAPLFALDLQVMGFFVFNTLFEMRKSFILHIDSLGILDELSDEQAGQLFKLIHSFHNPNKPKQTQITQVVNLAFYSFKSQFERDFEAYNNVCERNKNNGIKGGRPKNNNPRKPKKADSKNDSKSKNNKISFTQSLIFDKVKFKEAFPEWEKEKLAYYYDSVLTWSNEGNKKVDWIATVRTWANKDEKQGKIKFVKQSQSNLQGTI